MIAPPLTVVRPLGIAALCFLIAIAMTPPLIRLLRRFKMGKTIREAVHAPIMNALHKAKAGTPTMGGIVIWASVLVVAFSLAGACWAMGEGSVVCRASFLSRGQTWLPLGLMAAAAVVGLLDDYLNIRRLGSGKGGGLRERERLLSYGLIAVIGAWWFFTKLSWDQLHIPFVGTYEIGWWYILFFIIVVVSTSHSVNVTDGLDGLAGGTLLASFAAFAIIAWSQGRLDLATFCAAIMGGLIGFLWFNVNPADVFMGDTGAMSLGTALAVVALMTNQPILLLLIGFPFVVESASVIAQVASKKIRGGKKLFLSSPIHHHLQAIGWSEPRIVMRFWMFSFILAVVGTVVALVDRI